MTTGNSDTHWLIVEPAPVADGRLETLLPALSQGGIEAYGARQRLVGRGPALLARGSRETLEGAALLLREHRFPSWILRPTRPLFHPARIFALEVGEEALVFACRDATVSFPRGSAIFAVLADLSGEVVEKNLRRLLARNAYRGAGALAPPGEEEILQAVLRASPVLDLYRLSPEGAPTAAVRVFPGRYDPKGLEERGALSGAGNLHALVDLAREYAGSFTLSADFGLASLPGCQPRRGESGEDLQKENLLALTRFGWLMTDLRAAGRSGAAEGVMAGSVAEESPPSGGVPPAGDLPFPPGEAVGDEDFGRVRAHLLGTASLLIPVFFWIGGAPLRSLLGTGWRTGAIAAIFSILLFLAGFQLLSWKRRIENTPTSRVRSLAMGMVELHGRALRRYALVSPMTQAACVWYRLRRYHRDRSGWRLKSTVSSGAVPFLLDDGTGRVAIDPRQGAVRPRIRQEGFEEGGGEKWVEEVIFEGTSLYVLGFVRPASGGASLRQRTAEALRLLKRNPEAMRRYDTDGDGRLSAAEWEAARCDAEAQAARTSLASGEGGGEAVVGKERGLPFIIAEAECPARVARGYALAVPLLLGGGVLLAVAAALLFLKNVAGS